jgi:hypothetical protein
VIEITIDEPTPSLNVLLGHHWTRRKKHRERWHWLTKQALGAAQVWVRPNWTRANLTIDRYGPRMLDADNFRAGTKFLTDSLVQAGIIVNDTPAVIGEPALRQIIGKERKTVVRIEEV